MSRDATMTHGEYRAMSKTKNEIHLVQMDLQNVTWHATEVPCVTLE